MIDRLLVDVADGGLLSLSAWLAGELPARVGPPAPLVLPLDGDSLEDLRWYLEDYLKHPYAAYAERGSDIAARLPAWGEGLFHAVFGPPESRAAYAAVRARGNQVEVVIRSASPELLGLPLADWVVPVHFLRRDVSFPGLRTERRGPSLDDLLDRPREEPVPEDDLAPVGAFVGRDDLFHTLESAARLHGQRLAAVGRLLRERRLLLVWDNFESVHTMRNPVTPPLSAAELDELKRFLREAGTVLITSPGEAGNCHPLAIVAQERGRWKQAERWFGQALALAELLGMRADADRERDSLTILRRS
ncbi:hypothetical protein ACU635_54870 [[Actinomadura] parvosata]|uniref:hypothetical protein n=1 Tax=[Actinomadura] parvosata TaxID=1955412 RepID=UPI00406C3A5E